MCQSSSRLGRRSPRFVPGRVLQTDERSAGGRCVEDPLPLLRGSLLGLGAREPGVGTGGLFGHGRHVGSGHAASTVPQEGPHGVGPGFAARGYASRFAHQASGLKAEHA